MKKSTSFSIILLLICITEIASADWSVNFTPPSSDQSTLSMTFPDGVNAEVSTTLAVELDNIDVSALLSYEDQTLFFTPVQALSLGSHTLRLFVIEPDGSDFEKAQWTFIVTKEMISKQNIVAIKDANIVAAKRWLKSSSFSADTLTEFSYRAKSKNIGQVLPDHAILSGGGNVQGALNGEKLSVTMTGNYFVQSEEDLSLTGKKVDIGEYRIAATYAGEAAAVEFALGHHDLGLNSMLISSFYRRGLSAKVTDNKQRITANIFSLNPEPQAGVDDFTGLSDSNNRLEGASVSFKPFSSEADALKVTGVYYNGEKTIDGIAVNDSNLVTSGSGWGVIAEQRLANGKINVRGEYANSQYDFDGSSGLAPEDDSEAVALSIKATPFNQAVLLDQPISVVFGANFERVDTFFQSLANPGLFADHETMSVFNDIYWGGLYTKLVFSNETNNVDDLINVPTDRLRDFNWSSNYTFTKQTGALAWFGSPSLAFSGFVSDLIRDRTPAGYTGPDTNLSSESYTIEGSSNYKTVSLSLSHQYSIFNDHTNTQSDTVDNLSSLGVNWSPSDRISMNANLQYDVFKDVDFDATNYTTSLNLGINSVLVANKVNLNLNYYMNHTSGNGDSQESHTINSELAWVISPATTNNPGLSFALRGSLENINGSTIKDETSYQVFAIFRVTAAISTAR